MRKAVVEKGGLALGLLVAVLGCGGGGGGAATPVPMTTMPPMMTPPPPDGDP